MFINTFLIYQQILKFVLSKYLHDDFSLLIIASGKIWHLFVWQDLASVHNEQQVSCYKTYIYK